MRGLVAIFLLLQVVAAEAYIGPGAGVSFFGSIWAIVVGIVISLLAVLIWPLRWFWRRMRNQAKAKAAKPNEPQA